MPRHAKAAKEGTVHEEKPPEAKTNGYPKGKLEKATKRWFALQNDIEKRMDEAKADCLPLREDQAKLINDLADDGIPKKEFKTVLRKMLLEQRLEHVADKLHDEQKDNYELMLVALGQLADTPLGEAAAEAEKPKPTGKEAASGEALH